MNTKVKATFDKAFWLARGATYREEVERGDHGPAAAYVAQEAALVDALAPLTFDTVLEIGCGFGRITRVVHDAFRPRGYLATDVSQDALTQAALYCEGPIQFRLRDLDAFGATPQYDLVLAAEVLMHRTQEQVSVDAEQMAELAIKYIVNVDWYEPAFKGEAPGCYQHDYSALFGKYGSVGRIDVPEARQAIWVTAMEARHGADS